MFHLLHNFTSRDSKTTCMPKHTQLYIILEILHILSKIFIWLIWAHGKQPRPSFLLKIFNQFCTGVVGNTIRTSWCDWIWEAWLPSHQLAGFTSDDDLWHDWLGWCWNEESHLWYSYGFDEPLFKLHWSIEKHAPAPCLICSPLVLLRILIVFQYYAKICSKPWVWFDSQRMCLKASNWGLRSEGLPLPLRSRRRGCDAATIIAVDIWRGKQGSWCQGFDTVAATVTSGGHSSRKQ